MLAEQNNAGVVPYRTKSQCKQDTNTKILAAAARVAFRGQLLYS